MATTTLLLHGMGGGPKSSFSPTFIRALQVTGRRVIVPDLYAGRRKPFYFGYYLRRARRIARNVRRAAGRDTLEIVGHSAGGLIGQVLAAELLADRLITICSVPPKGISIMSRSIFRILMKHLRDMLSGGAIAPRAEELESLMFSHVPPDERQASLAAMRPEGGFAILEVLYGVRINPIPVPMLCIGAGEDRIITPDVSARIAEHYHATLLIFEGHGHLLPSEPGAEALAGAIADWTVLQQ